MNSMKQYLILVGISLVCFTTLFVYIYFLGDKASSNNIQVAVNTVTSNKPNQLININKKSSLTVDVEKFNEPSKIIEINKNSGLTVDADTDYDRRRPININKKSSLTQGGVLDE